MTGNIKYLAARAYFDLADPEQQKLAFHYSNLQPLWAHENLTKQAKW
jgi:hypothetical protein